MVLCGAATVVTRGRMWAEAAGCWLREDALVVHLVCDFMSSCWLLNPSLQNLGSWEPAWQLKAACARSCTATPFESNTADLPDAATAVPPV